MDLILVSILLLLGSAVAVILLLHRWNVPSSLGYLFVGMLLGPHTMGPVVADQPVKLVAEFGIVFLLFTIGLSFSWPQIRVLRHLVLGLGTAQVLLCTGVVTLLGWLAGLDLAVAFIVGAVFAQSSTIIISKQLADQAEAHGRHARLGIGMSVFQDVTAVPFVVIIPVLAGTQAMALGYSLGWAVAKAVLALALVFWLGRLLLRPLFHMVAASRSAELFTMTVLLISLLAGWVTMSLGLSMAFGAFLAGMVLGETEFRHQVESTIRPFRDVLLGLFFIGVGMLVDPMAMLQTWQLALLGAGVLLSVKLVIVTMLVRRAGLDLVTACRVGVLLAVGGEFGFALLALGMEADVVPDAVGQVVLASVFLSMLGGALLIRWNHRIALWWSARVGASNAVEQALPALPPQALLHDHVLLLGYGRVGQGLARLLEEQQITFAAVDLDAGRVREARLAGQNVHFGDGAQLDILEALGLSQAGMVVITHDDTASALRCLRQVRQRYPDTHVIVRTRDPTTSHELRSAGASEVIPETLEATLMIGSEVMRRMGVAASRVAQLIQAQRDNHYRDLRALLPGDALQDSGVDEADEDRLQVIQIDQDSPWLGCSLDDLPLQGGQLRTLVRDGRRVLAPAGSEVLQLDDALVIAGAAVLPESHGRPSVRP